MLPSRKYYLPHYTMSRQVCKQTIPLISTLPFPFCLEVCNSQEQCIITEQKSLAAKTKVRTWWGLGRWLGSRVARPSAAGGRESEGKSECRGRHEASLLRQAPLLPGTANGNIHSTPTQPPLWVLSWRNKKATPAMQARNHSKIESIPRRGLQNFEK